MLEQLYADKIGLFEELAALSQELAGFGAQELLKEEQSLEKMEGLLAQRAQLIKRIDALDAKMVKLAGPPVAEAWQQSLREIGEGIAQENKKIEAVLREGLGQVRQKTRQIQEGKQTTRAYRQRGDAGEGHFIDKRR